MNQMTKFLNISHWLLLLMVLVMASCAVANKEDMAMVESMEKIDPSYEVDKQFSAEQLGRGNLIAFESRAKEKLIDFFNYLTIISDPKYDDAFKSHAVNLASDLFVNTDVDMAILDAENEIKVQQLLDNHLNGQYGQRRYEVISVEIADKLTTTTSGNYNGTLSFDISVTSNNHSVLKNKGEITIKAMKIEKYFGQDKRSVWEVFLGE